MPLEIPVLDDRNFEQLLDEAKRRIPAHTPEWTNYNVESDPGITLVQLFASLTDTLLYRANRIPENNRLKFLQLLGIPLQPAAAADGLVTIRNERGPLEALTLGAGVVVEAGKVSFLTRDDLTVLPVEGRIYYKKEIPETDDRYPVLEEQHLAALEAIKAARESAGETAGESLTSGLKLVFYETTAMTLPSAGDPQPATGLKEAALDDALYIALLAPRNVLPEDVRPVIAGKTLSLGILPALQDEIDPIVPQRPGGREPLPELVFEIPDVAAAGPGARYRRLQVLQYPPESEGMGVIKLLLPDTARLESWSFAEPLDEGSGDYPPRLEDDAERKRLVTWIRLRLPRPAAGAQAETEVTADTRLAWLGVNAVRIRQAVAVVNEALGQGSGEPDQAVALANVPVLPDSLLLELQAEDGSWQAWRQLDDLLSAGLEDPVFSLDPEAGVVRFGDGLHGMRPAAGQRLRASYQYGGGSQGNLAIGEVKNSPDLRLQGGFKIENPIPTSGGDTGESVSEGEKNIPLYLRHRDRLVTAQDFLDIARRTPGVDMGRAEVLPLFYPPEPSLEAAGIVTLLVIPAFDSHQPLWPSPDTLFLRRVCNHLAPRRLVTLEIFVRGPEYVAVNLSVGVQVRQGYYFDQVLQEARQRLQEYLSALPPGGPEETGWPLGRRLFKRELEAVVTRLPGVDFVDSMYMGVGDELDLEEYNQISGLKLPLLLNVFVRAGEAESLDLLLGQTPAEAPQVEIVPMPVIPTKC